MKNSILIVTVLAMVSLGLSCSPQEEIMGVAPAEGKTVIVATTGSGSAGTRIAFEDKGTDGVKQTWEASDKFLLYDAGGKYAATFAIKGEGGSSSAEFESDAVLADGTYTAVYPAVDDPAKNMPTLAQRNKIISGTTQKGNGNLDHIDGQCYMDAMFTYSATTSPIIQFAIEYVMMTVMMEKPADYDATADGVPTNLTFINGNKASSLKLENVSWSGDEPIKAYMLVEPMTAPEGDETRTLRFDLICGDGVIFQKTVSSTKAYAAGKRYTASLSENNKLEKIAGYTLQTLGSIPETLNTWVITDAITVGTSLSFLREKIYHAEREISLILPNATGIDPSSVSFSTNLVSISFPKVTTVGNRAFRDCINLRSVSLPEVESIGNGAFMNCSRLGSIGFPKLKNIGNSAFISCTDLVDISLPEVETIGDGVFQKCVSLTAVNLPKATAMAPNTFYRCTALISASLPELTGISGNAFSECTALASITAPKVTNIGANAFAECTALVNLALPEATTISTQAFNGCTKLESVSLPKAEVLMSNVFYKCIGLRTLDMATESAGLTSVEDFLFQYDTSLSNIDLTVGTGESSQVNLSESKWRGYGPFKSITVKQTDSPIN